MPQYHIGSNGPSVCRARVKPCPFGGETGTENHFSTKEECQTAYEQSMKNSIFTETPVYTPETVHTGLDYTEADEQGVFIAESYQPTAKELTLRERLYSVYGDSKGHIPDSKVASFVEAYRPKSSPYLDTYRTRLNSFNTTKTRQVSVGDYLNGSLSQLDSGGTFSFTRGTIPTSGLCYSPYPEHSRVVDLDSNEKLYETLADFQEEHETLLAEDDHYIGVWRDSDGTLYIDVSVVTQDASEARKQCAEHDQIAFYDLTAQECPNVNTDATSGRTE